MDSALLLQFFLRHGLYSAISSRRSASWGSNLRSAFYYGDERFQTRTYNYDANLLYSPPAQFPADHEPIFALFLDRGAVSAAARAGTVK